MNGVAQMALPIAAKLPVDPYALVDLPPTARGMYYNVLGFTWQERQAVEEALRMVAAGTYPEAAS